MMMMMMLALPLGCVREAGFHRGGIGRGRPRAGAVVCVCGSSGVWCVWSRSGLVVCASCWREEEKTSKATTHSYDSRARCKNVPTPWTHTALACLLGRACLVGVSCCFQAQEGRSEALCRLM